MVVVIDHKDNISSVDNNQDSKTAGRALINKKGPPKKELKSKDRASRTKTEAEDLTSSKKKQIQDRKKNGIYNTHNIIIKYRSLYYVCTITTAVTYYYLPHII